MIASRDCRIHTSLTESDPTISLQTVGKKYAKFCILVGAPLRPSPEHFINYQRINNKHNHLASY